MSKNDAADHDRRLKELEQRLEQARRKRGSASGRDGAKAHAATHHLVLRLLADMGVAMAAGVLLGWGIDSYFGTRPWGILAGVLLGLAAGVRNVLHTADTMARQAHEDAPAGGTARDMSSINGKNAQNDDE